MRKLKKMNKPSQKVFKYYDYDEVVKYLGWSPEKDDIFWDWICEHSESDLNGAPIRVSNWEIVYENGKFAEFLEKYEVLEMVKEITESLGEPVPDSNIEGEREIMLVKKW